MGLHVFFGCYFNLFRLMAKCGVLENLLLKDHTHTFVNNDGDVRELDFRFKVGGATIGAPFHGAQAARLGPWVLLPSALRLRRAAAPPHPTHPHLACLTAARTPARAPAGLKAFFTTPQLTAGDKVANALALGTSPIVRALVDPEGGMRDIRNLDNVSFADWFKSHGGSEQSIKKMWDPIGACWGGRGARAGSTRGQAGRMGRACAGAGRQAGQARQPRPCVHG